MAFKYHITVTSSFVSFDCFGKSRLEYRLLYCVAKSLATSTIHLRENKSTQVVSASSYNTTMEEKKRDNTIKPTLLFLRDIFENAFDKPFKDLDVYTEGSLLPRYCRK